MTDNQDAGLLVVNYHYIQRRDNYPYPGIYPVDPEVFKAQVEWLTKRFFIPTPAQVEAFALGKEGFPGPGVFLTFDDGLAEHGRVAREVLGLLGVKAAFAVSSRPIVEKKALLVHKIHWLRATTEPGRFREEFMGLVPEKWVASVWDDGARQAALEIYVYDTPEDALLKYLINFLIPNDVADGVATEMLRGRDIEEEAFCTRFYLGEREIRELTHAGHVVGNHGHSHIPFSRLSESELDHEIGKSKEAIEGVTGVEQRWVSYPNGRTWALPKDPKGFCMRYGFTMGLALDGGWNRMGQAPYQLVRLNENDVKNVLPEWGRAYPR